MAQTAKSVVSSTREVLVGIMRDVIGSLLH
ncbi:MAG: hypothetical protein ACI841_002633 [Planctomycetota bacterium]